MDHSKSLPYRLRVSPDVLGHTREGKNEDIPASVVTPLEQMTQTNNQLKEQTIPMPVYWLPPILEGRGFGRDSPNKHLKTKKT